MPLYRAPSVPPRYHFLCSLDPCLAHYGLCSSASSYPVLQEQLYVPVFDLWLPLYAAAIIPACLYSDCQKIDRLPLPWPLIHGMPVAPVLRVVQKNPGPAPVSAPSSVYHRIQLCQILLRPSPVAHKAEEPLPARACFPCT